MERLDKLLAAQGKMSRKEARTLVRDGLVTVDGEIAKTPEQKVNGGESIAVRGNPLVVRKHLYIMMNKPAGVVCATRDQRETTVLELLPEELRRKNLFPAGRLDKDTEGFVLLTDDGAFAHRILAPKNHIPKTYVAIVSGRIGEDIVDAFAGGLQLDKGERASPAQLRVLGTEGDGTRVELVIYEGLYHQVKRMFARFGRRTLFLKRTKIGDLELDPCLSPGESREIVNKELQYFC